MEIYLVRHAIAAPRGVNFHTDADRPLTQDGIAKMHRHVGALQKLRVHLDAVLTSPYLRARQTAEILAEGFVPRPMIQVCPALAPEGDLEDVIAELRQRPMTSAVALVGHAPDLGHLASLLLCNSPEGDVELKKGGVCRIDAYRLAPPYQARLRWLLTARQLRLIAKADK